MRHLYPRIVIVSMLMLFSSCADESNPWSSGEGDILLELALSSDMLYAQQSRADNYNAVEFVPEIDDLVLTLRNEDASVNEKWSSASNFPNNSKFKVGNYSMEAYYGSINDEGFDKPYYYGNTKFTVYDGETTSVSLVAQIANSMVSILYTEAFINYFATYSAKIHADGGGYILYASDEKRPAYVRPGNVLLTLSLEKQNGVAATIEATTFKAEPRHHYNVTFDVNGGSVGDAQLIITIDDTTIEEPVVIDLSDELLNAPAPTINGISDGDIIEILEGESPEMNLKTDIIAMGGLKSVTLTTSSPYLTAIGWPAELDLLSATPSQQATLSGKGFAESGLWKNPDKMAVIDFGGVASNLMAVNDEVTTHTFTLSVTDKLSKISGPITFSILTEPVTISLQKFSELKMQSNELSINVLYNGASFEENVKFMAKDDSGLWVDCKVSGVSIGENGMYNVQLNVPASNSALELKATYKNLRESNILTISRKTPEIQLYANDYDIWARKIGVGFNSTTFDVSRVLDNITLFASVDQAEFTKVTFEMDKENAMAWVTGLEPATNYTFMVSCTDDINDVSESITITTETAQQVENNQMEDWYNTFKYGEKTAWVGIDIYEWFPKGSDSDTAYWSSRNPMTTSQNSGASCYYTSYSGTLSTSGVSGNAAEISTLGWGEGNTFTNTMTGVIIRKKSAGMLFMGDYTYTNGSDKHYDGSEAFDYGRQFSSRPSVLTFQYKYAPIESEKFRAYIVIENRENGTTTELGRGELISGTSTSSFTKAEIPISYNVTNKKATHAYIVFISSTAVEPAVTNVKGSKNAFAGYADSRYVGSVLTVDDIILEY